MTRHIELFAHLHQLGQQRVIALPKLGHFLARLAELLSEEADTFTLRSQDRCDAWYDFRDGRPEGAKWSATVLSVGPNNVGDIRGAGPAPTPNPICARETWGPGWT
eukprot:scaffold32864_cov28-Tisochrysis_lutea.AAC.7